MRDIIVFLTALKVEAWLGTCDQDPERVLLIKPTAEQLPQVENFWTGLKSSPTPSAVTTPR
jgi:hypothetical protein